MALQTGKRERIHWSSNPCCTKIDAIFNYVKNPMDAHCHNYEMGPNFPITGSILNVTLENKVILICKQYKLQKQQ